LIYIINLKNEIMMKIFMAILSLITFVSTPLMAQNQGKVKENVLNLKMEYFKNNFKISDEKAEKFWLLFGEYLKAERKIHEETKKQLEEKGIKKEKGKIDFTKLSDEQIYFYCENQFKQRERLVDSEQKFYQQMKGVLSAQEIAEFYRLEKEFKRELSEIRN